MALDKVGKKKNSKMIGVVVPIDYLSIQSGAAQRIKADLAALVHSGYDVEVIFPSSTGQPKNNLASGLTLAIYHNSQRFKFLPEKVRLLLDMYTQMFNPFFRAALRKRYRSYSVILAHFPWSAVSSYRVVKREVPLVYVAHDYNDFVSCIHKAIKENDPARVWQRRETVKNETWDAKVEKIKTAIANGLCQDRSLDIGLETRQTST